MNGETMTNNKDLVTRYDTDKEQVLASVLRGGLANQVWLNTK